MNIRIGEVIKSLRNKNKVTQKSLAVYLGVTEQAVSKWESGTGYPDIELLPTIADFFSITVDYLLGVDKTERDKRLEEIYNEIKNIHFYGNSNEETLQNARSYAAEFPSNETILCHLANEICNLHQWSEKPNVNYLTEAEKIYISLIDNTKNIELKNDVIGRLAILYAQGFKNFVKCDDTLNMLTDINNCREIIKAVVYRNTNKDLKPMQNYFKAMLDQLMFNMTNYIIYSKPNEGIHGDSKIEVFEKMIELYKFIIGDNLLDFNDDVAYLYRIIATYKIAQGKKEETLSVLEKMCHHVELGSKVKDGDKYTGYFTDLLTYENPNDRPITLAQETLNDRLAQDRYDSIREDVRFKQIEETLKKIVEAN